MILGIDYGLRNMGFAISEGEIASPAGTISVKDGDQALEALRQIVLKWSVKKVVVGISGGKSKHLALEFGKKLSAVLRLPVEYVDETLSTVESKSKSRPKTKSVIDKEKSKEHARAAAVILQRYLDERRD